MARPVLKVGRTRAPYLSGEVNLSSFPPALLVFMRHRVDEGATNKEIMAEFGVGENTVTALRKCDRFNKSHLRALKKGLPDAYATIASASLSAITEDKLKSCSAPQLMVTSGVAFDKLRLAQGESTANISFRDAGSVAADALANAKDMFESSADEINSTHLQIDAISTDKLDNGASPTERMK